jgi:hypothetical protein
MKHLLQVPAVVRFISAEPLMGPLKPTGLGDCTSPKAFLRRLLILPLCRSGLRQSSRGLFTWGHMLIRVQSARKQLFSFTSIVIGPKENLQVILIQGLAFGTDHFS